MKTRILRRILIFAMGFLVAGTGLMSHSYGYDDKYDAYKDPSQGYQISLYAVQQGSSDYGEVVYCFNKEKTPPPSKDETTKPFDYYKKNVGTAELFMSLAKTPRLDTTLSGAAQAKDFRTKVLRVLYSGYPLNKTGIKQKYGLADSDFRRITQYAVWYYTDSAEYNEVEEALKYEELWDALNEMLSLNTVLPETFGLNLFTPQPADSIGAQGYQNLLSSGVYYADDPKTPSTPKKTAVTISKTELGKTAELRGASLKLVKGESSTGTEVTSWTSGDTPEQLTLQEGVYTLVETAAPNGYEIADAITFRITDTAAVEIKNSDGDWASALKSTIHMEDKLKALALDKVNIDVTKRWEDKNNKDGIRPDNVEVILYADGQKTDKIITLNETGKWQGSFVDLDKYKDGKEVNYTIKEVNVKDYTSAVSGSMTKGYVITNSYDASYVKTGDSTNIMLFIIMAIASIGAIICVTTLKRKN